MEGALFALCTACLSSMNASVAASKSHGTAQRRTEWAPYWSVHYKHCIFSTILNLAALRTQQHNLEIGGIFFAVLLYALAARLVPPTEQRRSPHCPAGNRRFGTVSALRAHTKAPYKIDLLWKTLRARKSLNRPGRARTADGARVALAERAAVRLLERQDGDLDEGGASFVTVLCITYRDSPYK